ncbi:hypothetical protein A7P92_08790 [Eikenella corrodens]|nr:hypothetical protein A7P92_08735 [Eikenella corrodens]OAM22847.1 hypothetical protein A7P92_08790 [Eikenella corrodens]
MSITLVLLEIANYQINTKMRMVVLVLRMAMFHRVKSRMMMANSQRMTNRLKRVKHQNNQILVESAISNL